MHILFNLTVGLFLCVVVVYYLPCTLFTLYRWCYISANIWHYNYVRCVVT